MTPAAIILAAGASSRMGSPKALLELNGETFLDRLIGLVAPYCDPVVVVLGFHGERIARGIRRAGPVRMVYNSEPERGMLSSLQAGIAALGQPPPDLLFTPVDAPAVAPATVEALISRWRERTANEQIFRPRCHGRRGHPVLVTGEIAAELAGLPATGSPRDVIQRHPKANVFIDVDDAAILADIDRPEDYAALAAAGTE